MILIQPSTGDCKQPTAYRRRAAWKKSIADWEKAKIPTHQAAILRINNLKVRSPIETLCVALILLLIAGTWILYEKPGEEKEKISTNSMRNGIPPVKSSVFTIHKP